MSPRDQLRGAAPPGASFFVLLACACISGAVCGQTPAVAQEDEALRDAIAGPLVEALSAQWGGDDVDMSLDRIATLSLGDGASIVSGTGTVRSLGRSGRSTTFSFRLPWNPWLKQAGYPEVSVAGVGVRNLPNDVALIRRLEADLTRKLARRTRQAGVSVRLDRITTIEGGPHLLRIDAQGVAYLQGNGGSRGLTILALYDRTRRSWQRLDYGLAESTGTWVAK